MQLDLNEAKVPVNHWLPMDKEAFHLVWDMITPSSYAYAVQGNYLHIMKHIEKKAPHVIEKWIKYEYTENSGHGFFNQNRKEEQTQTDAELKKNQEH